MESIELVLWNEALLFKDDEKFFSTYNCHNMRVKYIPRDIRTNNDWDWILKNFILISPKLTAQKIIIHIPENSDVFRTDSYEKLQIHFKLQDARISSPQRSIKAKIVFHLQMVLNNYVTNPHMIYIRTTTRCFSSEFFV